MGMYSALMQEIQKGLEELRKEEGKVVEITRTGKVVSAPFILFKKEERLSNQEASAST
jgi:superfamily II helicase